MTTPGLGHWLLGLLVAAGLHALALAVWPSRPVAPAPAPAPSSGIVIALRASTAADTTAGQAAPMATPPSPPPPAPVAMAVPDPVPDPEPVPDPAPDPVPHPEPVPDPVPEPVRGPVPVPTPTPPPVADPAATPADTRAHSATAVADASEPAAEPAADTTEGRATAGEATAGHDQGYLDWLRAELERHRRYPAQAERRRLQGTVVLTFSIDANGLISEIGLAASSGHALLDQEALRLLQRYERQALPRPPHGPISGVTLPVVFELR